ncbi:YutD family protein [Streptococcus castoreus]|uniref:YutD family protein n=1 Tax=Streptococcus castoreus TaxID=254786 RepID=UPI00040F14BC|nr:YutD family protein [Streptococcus castoreus]
MKKDISPEMYNYNKFPGPEFIHFDHHVKADEIELYLLENVKDAFNTTSFSQRYTDILLKYDYIVGDWGNEQLRLKGFYKDTNDVKKTNRISRLEDYLKEFCNFGCAYFVLENLNPKELTFEEERQPRRKKSSKPNRRRPNQLGSKPKSKSKKASREKQPEKQAFTSKKRRETNNTVKSQTNQLNAKSDHFIIRKKDN